MAHPQQAPKRTGLAARVYLSLFARPSFQPLHRKMLVAALRGMGILNFDAQGQVTGEDSFLRRYLTHLPQSNPVVMDIGANRGSYTALIKRIRADAQVHAFEPNPACFAELGRALEHVPGVTLNPVGMGSEVGALTLYDRITSPGSTHATLYPDAIEGIYQDQAVPVTVQVNTVDAYLASMNIDNVALLKTDTEGHDFHVLRGAQNALRARNIRAIQFEFNELNIHSRAFMRDFVELLAGYRLYRLLPNALIPLPSRHIYQIEVFAYQNIVALSDDVDVSWLMDSAHRKPDRN